MSVETIECDDLDAAIDRYTTVGYRLDMIRPAHEPREAIMSEPPAVAGGSTQGPSATQQTRSVRLICVADDVQPPATAGGSDWTTGRAGMQYRDLTPEHLRGKFLASHIRVAYDGDVPDHVHYHKLVFQMIYCVRGRIRVVYEDQGPPFWLETGDCILQPPEIRHRVLESTEAAEVIEVSVPADHETWIDHDMDLPTGRSVPDREFCGQKFVRHIAAGGVSNDEGRDLGFASATNGLADVRVTRSADPGSSVEGVLSFPVNDDKFLVVNLSSQLLANH